MRRIMVRYEVTPEKVTENEALVRAVYQELHTTDPPGFRSATFKLDDGVTFVHLASVDPDKGENPLPALDSFAKFQEGINDRCSQLPVSSQLDEIGSYGIGSESI